MRSTATLILVLRPPRERPMASFSLPPLRAPHAGECGRWCVDHKVFEIWVFY